MTLNSSLRKGLLAALLATTIISSKISNKNNLQQQINVNSLEDKIKNEKITESIPIESLEEYNSFIKSNINKFYISDIEEVYNFFNIKRDLPKYGFKANKRQFICSDCEGAIYLASDSIYFYSSCTQELFSRYKNMFGKDKNEIIERLHHNIKHEAAHAFYYNLAKEINKEEVVEKIPDNIPFQELVKKTIISEGVAEYIAYKGKLTREASMLSNEYLKDITENDEYNLYNLGFMLVKPILDKNFEEGVKMLIQNQLKMDDLNNLPEYREKILKML